MTKEAVEAPETPVPPPVCRCLHCGNDFTIRPHVNMDRLAGYAERLSKVTCFKCGAESGFLKVIA